MQFTTTTALITLLTAASMTLAAPAPAPAPQAQTNTNNACNQPPVVAPNNNSNNNLKDNGKKAATLQARIQLEIERQTTFIQREVPIPGRIPLNLDTLFSAFIVQVEDIASGESVGNDNGKLNVVCQAFDARGRAVGTPIGADRDNALLNGGEGVATGFIECVEA